MDLLNKVKSKLKPKSTIETDAVPTHSDRNGNVQDSRIPPVSIEELFEEENSPLQEDSSPIITDPSDDAPPVPPRRKKAKAKQQSSRNDNDFDAEDKDEPRTPPINTQASGSVINIVNSSSVHVGSSVTCHFGSPDGNVPFSPDNDDSEASVPKTKSVVAVMSSTEELSHEYMDVWSRNLGSGWKKVFRKLGYTDPVLETFYETHYHKGVPELIYQILLDWTRTGQRTLGELCTVTWKQGKRLAVAEVAKVYKENKKNID